MSAGRPIRNYRYALSIVDNETVSVDWLRARVVASSKQTLLIGAPSAWCDYVRGRTGRRQVWKANVRSTDAQLPRPSTTDDGILQQLIRLSPRQFEAVIVALFREMKTVEHSITQTRYVNDSGFDLREFYNATARSLRGPAPR